MALLRSSRLSPARIVTGGFLLLILTGTLLLMLPFATREAGGAPFLDALFTATSATCVTGLVTHDTFLYWTTFGQAVILLLIQVGGMGVVTMAVAIFMFMGRRIGLKQRWVLQESISAPHVGGIVELTGFILKTAAIIEGAGALLLAIRFIPRFGLLRGLWYGLFHSISAFCNAGFDLMGEGGACSSLTAYGGDGLVNGVVMALILLGGIGFFTWDDLRANGFHFRRFRLQTKLILCASALLLIGAFLFYALYEFVQPQWSGLTLGDRLLVASFQSVTPRTAGFNSVDLGQLSQPGKLVTILLMLTGGAPSSTAGGVKVTTVAVLLLSVRAVFQHRESAQCFRRRIPVESFRSAAAIFVLYLGLFLAAGIFLACWDGAPLIDALFETASAVGTVGLSIYGTANFSPLSQLVLCVLMYFGRVGGLTLLYAAAAPDTGRSALSNYPQESVTVG